MHAVFSIQEWLFKFLFGGWGEHYTFIAVVIRLGTKNNWTCRLILCGTYVRVNFPAFRFDQQPAPLGPRTDREGGRKSGSARSRKTVLPSLHR